MYYLSDPMTDDSIAPYKRTVGMEVEFSSGSAVGWFYQNNYAPDDHLHGYGCNCNRRANFPIHPTQDCTAPGGEYIIGGPCGVLYGSDRFYKATAIAEKGFIEGRCTSDDRVGMHTHVGNTLSIPQQRILLRNYLAMQEDFQVFASGAAPCVRNNDCTSPRLPLHDYLQTGRTYIRNLSDVSTSTWNEFWASDPRNWNVNLPGRPTLNFQTGKGTIEFRVWNSSRVQWRMVLAAGISSAFVEAAAQERIAPAPERIGRNEVTPTLTLEEFLDGLLTPDLIGLMARQREARS